MLRADKDLYTLGAKVDTKNATCSCECAGVVTQLGKGISDLSLGDRIVVMAPGHFATYDRVPRWAVTKLRDHELYTASDISTLVCGPLANIQQRRCQPCPWYSPQRYTH